MHADLGDMDDSFTFTEDRSGRSRGLNGLFVDGRLGNDQLFGATGAVVFSGGWGNDVLEAVAPAGLRGYSLLEGGPGDDRLFGTKGHDIMDPGRGADFADGRAGRDVFAASVDGWRANGAFSPDVFVGGEGRDTVEYSGRSTVVVVDLGDDQPDGAAGEGDRLSQIEDVTGGKGDDLLAGNRNANWLFGGLGHDRLIGRGGNDTFWTAAQPLRSDAASEYGQERVSCGPGRDRLIGGASRGDFLDTTCEQIALGSRYRTITVLPRQRRDRLDYRVRCPRFDPGLAPRTRAAAECSGAITVTRPSHVHRMLAFGTFRPGKWNNHRLTAALTPLGRRLTEERRGIKAVVTLQLRTRHADGARSSVMSWTTRLTGPCTGRRA
jgi:hypothetical protein